MLLHAKTSIFCIFWQISHGIYCDTSRFLVAKTSIRKKKHCYKKIRRVPLQVEIWYHYQFWSDTTTSFPVCIIFIIHGITKNLSCISATLPAFRKFYSNLVMSTVFSERRVPSSMKVILAVLFNNTFLNPVFGKNTSIVTLYKSYQ